MSTAVSALYPSYARADLSFCRGEGAWLEDTNGRRFLDFAAGVAVNALGHAHPHLIAALTEQAHKLWHVSNIYMIPEQERLARRLCVESFAELVFFTNSGAEAVETALKTARRFHYARGCPERFRIVTFEGAFHGRTLATLAAGGRRSYLEGFGPPLEGFDAVPFGDFEAVQAAIGPQTAGILLEPIQGEGGVCVAPPTFLKRLRELCDAEGLVLIMDEVQTGVGRTGRLFAHQLFDVEPDIMAIAKGIGNGFPLGACLARQSVGEAMTAGTHGSTYGGNPLAMAVGNAVLDIVLAEGFLEEVQRKALFIKQGLAQIIDGFPHLFKELRGEGLLLGLACHCSSSAMIAHLREEGLLTVGAAGNVVRLLPPLTVRTEEITQALRLLEHGAASFCTKEKFPTKAG